MTTPSKVNRPCPQRHCSRRLLRSLFRPSRAVRRLAVANQQPESPPPRSPTRNPGRAANPVIEEAPASPMVYCSQYRMEAYERRNEPLHQKVGGWLRDLQAAYASDGPSPYPTDYNTIILLWNRDICPYSRVLLYLDYLTLKIVKRWII